VATVASETPFQSADSVLLPTLAGVGVASSAWQHAKMLDVKRHRYDVVASFQSFARKAQGRWLS
jgi:hypothetical protein